MKKTVFFSLVACFTTVSAFAAEGDLELPGEKWLSRFDRYVCDYDKATSAPKALAELKVNFERMSSDQTLDNALLLANFEENGVACRYSAILLADNAAFTSRLVDSKAFSVDGTADCARGKAVLDAAFANNTYLYYGHPHRLALMMPVEGAEAVCGEGKTLVGAEFVVTGKKK